jgi:CheY-like chemotaxis protein
LSLCQGIVDSHGGTISVDNAPGGGAVFTIVLPVVEAPAGERKSPAVAGPLTGLRILIVEDEPEVAEVLADMLAIDRHVTDIASHGAVALARLRENAYDLVVSDLRMPELDGPGLYRALEAAGHPLRHRFVFVTGDVLGSETREFLERTHVLSLAKPFMLAEVQAVVREARERGTSDPS